MKIWRRIAYKIGEVRLIVAKDTLRRPRKINERTSIEEVKNRIGEKGEGTKRIKGKERMKKASEN